jgi:uncharacterized protein YraI
MRATKKYSNRFVLAILLGFLLSMGLALDLATAACVASVSPQAGPGDPPPMITAINPNKGCSDTYIDTYI